MEDVSTSDPSIPKILLSAAEFERLKAIEVEYQTLLKTKEKHFENTTEGQFKKIVLK
jgi:hypothetical protein